jgi:hypothetical protein
VPVTDPPPVEPSKATEHPAPKSVDREKDPACADSDKDPESPAEKRQMKASIDDFLKRD